MEELLRSSQVEKEFYGIFPDFRIMNVVVDRKVNHSVVKIYCSWNQYTIPREVVLAYDVKREYAHLPWIAPGDGAKYEHIPWTVEFNPFTSDPKYPNTFNIDWIRLYIIDKIPGLSLIEAVLSKQETLLLLT